MSAYAEYRTQIKDEEALIAALCKLTNRVGESIRREWIERHEQPVTLEDYRGQPRPERAEIRIPNRYVGGAANDIGFQRQADGTFTAIISEYDRRHYDRAWLDKLAVEYGRELINRNAKKLGYRVTETRHADGSVRMVLTRR